MQEKIVAQYKLLQIRRKTYKTLLWYLQYDFRWHIWIDLADDPKWYEGKQFTKLATTTAVKRASNDREKDVAATKNKRDFEMTKIKLDVLAATRPSGSGEGV